MNSEQLKYVNSVLFVCLGNICRSPTAHAVFRQLAKQKLPNILVDSAGTAAYHRSSPPDARARAVGQERGYDFSKINARPVVKDDFKKFDLILPMDKQNYQDLLAKSAPEDHDKIVMFLEFSEKYQNVIEVPDPYYGGNQGFEYVLDLVEDASRGLLKKLS